MSAVEVIERVLRTGVLMEDLTIVPAQGASDREIDSEQHAIGRQFSPELKNFLRRWNGANLDVLVLFGCGRTHAEIPRFRDRQILRPTSMEDSVIICSDPAGFLFAESPDRRVISIDSQGGACKAVGSSFNDFICRFVFGGDSDLFGGEEWKQELRGVGLFD
jgi:hypothetical protein